jgi:hypothetical protein
MVWAKRADAHIATAKSAIGCVHREWGDGPGMEYGEVPAGEQHANAWLIAAAPDLLAAAQYYLSLNGPDECGCIKAPAAAPCVLCTFRKAIKKAGA